MFRPICIFNGTSGTGFRFLFSFAPYFHFAVWKGFDPYHFCVVSVRIIFGFGMFCTILLISGIRMFRTITFIDGLFCVRFQVSLPFVPYFFFFSVYGRTFVLIFRTINFFSRTLWYTCQILLDFSGNFLETVP